jgi:hypothetical protein
MVSDDATPLFTCESPAAARGFLRRLRLRQQAQFLGIFGACAVMLFICTVQDAPRDFGTVLDVFLVLGGIGLAICLMIAVSARVLAPRGHAFYDQMAVIHVGGVFTVSQEAPATKLREIVFFPASFGGAHFHLVLVIFRHVSNVWVPGIGQVGGVYPVYFCIHSSDVDRISQWCRDRKIHLAEGAKVISPWKLPLFIK